MIHPDRNLRPPVKGMGALSLAPAQVYKLPDGITLHIVNTGTTEVSRLTIALPGGQADSPRPGLFDAMATLLPEGSVENPGTRMADILESNGAWSGASVTTHHTLINLFTLNDVFDTVLPLAAQMAFSPAFEPEAVTRALRIRASQAAVDMRKVSTQATRAMRPRLYGADNPLALSPTPEDILSFTPQEMHEAHTVRLCPDKTHIFLAGKVTEGMIGAVMEQFGSVSGSNLYEVRRLVFDPHPTPGMITTEVEGALQNAIRIAIPTPGRSHPDFLRLRLATNALGGYFGSRLMMSIREEKGLTYGIGASLYAYPDNGYMIISTDTDTSNTDEVIEGSVAEIERLKDPASFTPDEVERLRSSMLSSLASVLDTPLQRMDFLQNEVIAGTPHDYFAAQCEAVREMSAESIAETAARYFDTTKMVISVAGKFGRDTKNA